MTDIAQHFRTTRRVGVACLRFDDDANKPPSNANAKVFYPQHARTLDTHAHKIHTFFYWCSVLNTHFFTGALFSIHTCYWCSVLNTCFFTGALF